MRTLVDSSVWFAAVAKGALGNPIRAKTLEDVPRLSLFLGDPRADLSLRLPCHSPHWRSDRRRMPSRLLSQVSRSGVTRCRVQRCACDAPLPGLVLHLKVRPACAHLNRRGRVILRPQLAVRAWLAG
jgi:hypothetical protein